MPGSAAARVRVGRAPLAPIKKLIYFLGPAQGRAYEKAGVWIGWAPPTKDALFSENLRFWPILNISAPSRPQKWIRLEILHRKMALRGLETQNSAIS